MYTFINVLIFTHIKYAHQVSLLYLKKGNQSLKIKVLVGQRFKAIKMQPVLFCLASRFVLRTKPRIEFWWNLKRRLVTNEEKNFKNANHGQYCSGQKLVIKKYWFHLTYSPALLSNYPSWILPFGCLPQNPLWWFLSEVLKKASKAFQKRHF